MAITLEANYSKKIGLPGYSSHQYSLTVKTEVSDISKVESESRQLFMTLQTNVDRDIQQTGWLPESNNQNGHRNGNANGTKEEPWECSPAQRDLILKIVEENNLDKAAVEKLAQDRFGKPVKKLNKLQASGLIEELNQQTGWKSNGGRRGYQRSGR
jgi:hypothetical protein